VEEACSSVSGSGVCAQQLQAQGQKGGASAVGQEAEMPNTHEALRKDVQ